MEDIVNSGGRHFADVTLKSKSKSLMVGYKSPIRLNCNVGISSEREREYELRRLDAILDSGRNPDTFMDLSIGVSEKPIYKEIQDRFDSPIGVVPSYLFPPNAIITPNDAVSILKRLADDGLAFFTLHLTADLDLYNLARKTRKIPVTSRGGGIILRQQLSSGEGNVWKTCLAEIIKLAKEYRLVISLGTTFRPAGIIEACDEVHLLETYRQLDICRFLQSEGVQVMVENVGHIAIDRLEKHCGLLSQFNAPIMPLGPTPTDAAIGMDHVAAAIGAAFMSYWGCGSILNCITRSEHSSSSFSIEETLEAIDTARIVAHIIDVSRGVNIQEDVDIYKKRATSKNCLTGAQGDCSRCSSYCPLKKLTAYERGD